MVWLPHDSWEATSRLDRCVLNICLAWWQYEQGVVRVVPMGSLVYQDAICSVHEDPQYKWPPILLSRKLDVSFLPIMMWKQEWYVSTSENFRNFIMFLLLVYLRTSPEKCMERIKKRSRDEETSVSMVCIASYM